MVTDTWALLGDTPMGYRWRPLSFGGYRGNAA